MAIEKAIFAGGCFWCMVKPFDQWDGVKSVISGYTNGHVENPTYEQVKTGTTGHYEAVEITFDNTIIDYESILQIYWQLIDPTNPDEQFKDEGSQYKAAIFYTNSEQQKIAEESKQELAESGIFTQPIVTEILPVEHFYHAEEYHQDYYKKSKESYEKNDTKLVRDAFIAQHWNN